MEDIASSSQNPLPLPLTSLTDLPWQRILDHEFVPVVKNQIMGIAFIEASFVKLDNEENLLLGYQVQSGLVINEGIVTAAHGLIDWDFAAFGWRIRPIEIISIGRIPVFQTVRALAIDAGTDLVLLEMPVLPEDFPLHIFQLSNSPAVTGEHVHTVGHPGQYDYSTRDGRDSFPSRPVFTVMPNLVDTPPGFYLVEVGFLAPPGFSGGPMINTAGQVVSVNHCIEHRYFE